ncbi:hypothetical protein GOV04_00535 [Candidatus Woesearchaeota archaeon]|nr:hypothetical protein [Candidatus Woesearchaeota archaeon]
MKITKYLSKQKALELGTSDCKKCGECCQKGAGFVLEKEIPVLAKYLNITVEEFKKKFLDEQKIYNTTAYRFKIEKKDGLPYGNCIFLHKKNCLIQPAKPLHCKIGGCHEHASKLNEWYMLNHFVNTEDPQSIREWAIKLKTHPTIMGGSLAELVPHEDTLKAMLEHVEITRELKEEIIK